ncbi:hypothetical protein ACERZ8_09600 [Tateyamaria armeniaca]|uniref:Right handed beta helix domain-containing protein n=1 Tax=Tateyamaria armeniaca TaxID=2518930 RepID=A0ABW8UWU5_9RHOB
MDSTGGRVVLRNLTLEAAGQIAVDMVGTGFVLQDLRLRCAASDAAPVQNAIRAIDVARSTIRRCQIQTAPGSSAHSAIQVRSLGDVLIADNQLQHAGDGIDCAWGGIHVMGDSTGIDIRGNRVNGALGHGITIGSVQWRATDGSDLGHAATGFGQMSPDEGVPFPTARLGPVPVDGQDYFPEPDLPMSDVLIADNEISGCRGSGIGALALNVVHSDVSRAAPLCMRRETFVLSGTIRGNRLRDNAAGPGAPDADRTRGGITLSDVQEVTIEDNRISGPGRTEASGPRCGIFAGFGSGIVLRKNKIDLRTGALTTDRDLSGGIVLSARAQDNLLELVVQDTPISDVRIEKIR